MYFNLKSYLFIIFSIIHITEGISDNRLSKTFYSYQDGLSNNDVNTIHIDTKGFLWVGTQNGLCYYDGYNFKCYHTEIENNCSIKNDRINKILSDINGNIWILTSSGVEVFQRKENCFISVSGIPDNETVFELKRNPEYQGILLLTRKGIYQSKVEIDKTVTKLLYHLKEDYKYIQSATLFRDSLWVMSDKMIQVLAIGDTIISKSIFINDLFSVSNSFTDLHLINENTLGILANPGLALLKSSATKINQELFPRGFNFQQISSIYPVSSSDIYCLNNGKYFVFNIKSMSIRLLDELNQEMSYLDNAKELIFDQFGVIWVASSKGLFKIQRELDDIELTAFSNIFNHGLLNKTYHIIPNRDRKIFVISKGNSIYQVRYSEGEWQYSRLFLPRGMNSELTTAYKKFKEDYYLLLSTSLYRYEGNSSIPKKLIESEECFFNDVFIMDRENFIIATSDGLLTYGYDSTLLDYKINSRFYKSFNIKKILFQSPVLYTVEEHEVRTMNLNTGEIETLFSSSVFHPQIVITDVLLSSDSTFWIGTNEGLYIYRDNMTSARMFECNWKYQNVYSLVESDSNKVWFVTDLGFASVNIKTGQVSYHINQIDYSELKISTGGTVSEPSILNFINPEGIVSVNPESTDYYLNRPFLEVTNIFIDNKGGMIPEVKLTGDTLTLQAGTRYCNLEFSILDCYDSYQNTYAYSFNKLNKDPIWISNGTLNTLTISRPTTGVYNLLIKGWNSKGVESRNIKSIIVIVEAPIWQSKIAFVLYGMVFFMIIYIAILVRTRQLRKLNREYKEREIIAKQVEYQKEELTIKNKNITDSIYYAKRIQMAMMPSVKILKALFPESFIFHMPKDIVSGDFYWVNEVDNRVFFAAVDCTGHGVPGAFMSIIGFELFRRITEIERITQPAEVLRTLSANFERLFRDVDDIKLRDGMDLAFCVFDKEKKILEYSGAFNPLYLIRNNSITEIKGDRYSVGLTDEDRHEQVFNNHVIPMKDGDTIYIFTDGYADQFGGPEGKKYKYRRFRHLLLALHQLPMDRQEEFLKKSILEWKGELDQVDDILVMGIRVTF